MKSTITTLSFLPFVTLSAASFLWMISSTAQSPVVVHGFGLSATVFSKKARTAPIITSSILFSSSKDDPSNNNQVVEAAKKIMENTGYFNPIDESLYSDEFIFRGPTIGPLNKADYKTTLDYFHIYKAFPDINPNCYGFTVDPEDPYRVWFFLRATGTYKNPIGGILGNFLKPNNQKYRGSQETWSITFDQNLKAKLMTAGYVVDRFDNNATTDGRGLSFGILRTLGLDLPFGVGDKRLQFVQAVNGPLAEAGITPIAVSAPEDIPSWWTNTKRGADP